MVQPARHPEATYQDVLDAPEHMVAELIDGALSLQPRPASRHGQASARLSGLLIPPFDLARGGPGGWVIHFEPELHLGKDVLVPDLAGWRRADHPSLDLTTAYIDAAPDWVCEVLSPSTQRLDRVRKLPRYAAAGVGHAWLVDPLARTLEVLELRGGTWAIVGTFAEDAIVEAPPFAAVPLELGLLWVPGEGVDAP